MVVDACGGTLLLAADGSKLLPGDTDQTTQSFALRLPRR